MNRERTAVKGNLSDQVLTTLAGDYRWSWRTRLPRFFGAVALSALGFGITCALLRLLVHDPINLYAEVRSEKLVIAKRWAALTSVAAFGSSHVDCGFDPRSFDESLAPQTARPVSLNLGVLGGSQIEQTAVAREYQRLVAAASSRRHLHLLLMEVNSGVNFAPEFMTHPRSINIYDIDALRLAFRFSDPKLGAGQAVGRFVVALFDSALHFMNVGMLSNQLFPPAPKAAILEQETARDRRGLTPPLPSPTDAKDAADIHAFAATLTTAPQGLPARITPGLCAEATALLDNGALSEGYRVVYFVTPKLADLLQYYIYPSTITCGGVDIPIINVALPLVHPELYDIGLWHDFGHLNEHGAHVYSRLLAQALKPRLDAESLASL